MGSSMSCGNNSEVASEICILERGDQRVFQLKTTGLIMRNRKSIGEIKTFLQRLLSENRVKKSQEVSNNDLAIFKDMISNFTLEIENMVSSFIALIDSTKGWGDLPIDSELLTYKFSNIILSYIRPNPNSCLSLFTFESNHIWGFYPSPVNGEFNIAVVLHREPIEREYKNPQ